MLFHSQLRKGAVMNRFGVVLDGAAILDREERDQVQAEARRAGWKLSDHFEGDHGRIWLPPAAQTEMPL